MADDKLETTPAAENWRGDHKGSNLYDISGSVAQSRVPQRT